MFCAASDQGNTHESTIGNDVPALYGDPIKIGAAKANGLPWDQTGQQYVDYYLPGHDIVIDGYKPAKGQPQSGSSLATAIATGLAALIQYCFRIACIDDNAYKDALAPQDFRDAFLKLSELSPTRHVPEVKKYFGNLGPMDEPRQFKAKAKTIAKELRSSLIRERLEHKNSWR